MERFKRNVCLSFCMKRELFNLADEEFMTLLERTDGAFRKSGISHIFVGGVAVQCYIARCLCEKYNTNLVELAKSGGVRIQDYLRSTDDVDLALKMNCSDEVEAGKKIYDVLDNIVGEGEFFSPSGEHIISIDLLRRGHVKPQFQVGVDGETNPDMVVAFNIYRKPKDLSDKSLREFEDRFYDYFIDRAVDLKVPYSGGRDVTLRVKNPSDLLTTKIVRGRPKDLHDASALVQCGRSHNNLINYKDIEKILCGNNSLYGVPNPELKRRYEVLMELVNLKENNE